MSISRRAFAAIALTFSLGGPALAQDRFVPELAATLAK